MAPKHLLKILIVLLVLTVAASAAGIPAGTRLTVRLTSEINSGTARVGDTFDGTLVNDVVVGGQTVAKAGTAVRGKVSGVRPSGRLSKPGLLSLRVTSVGNQSVSTASVSRQGKSHTKSNVTKIGGGAAAGTVIGGLAGGGKGAAIGTAVGAGAGTGVAAATGKQEALFPAETVVTFTTTSASTAKAK